VVLLPLYPQFSTATTQSSLDRWKKCAKLAGLEVPTRAIGCYPINATFVASHVSLLKKSLEKLQGDAPCRVLFSAHGLPKKVIEKGDPYQWQVEQTVEAIVNNLDIDGLDYQVCYQSRVGPLEWIGPSTDDEITRAGHDKKSVVLVPVAFVSEHSETLVELDIEYGELAKEQGVTEYIRVPTLSCDDDFIKALAQMVTSSGKDGVVVNDSGKRLCPGGFEKCACASV
jgi:ferrochelatase